MVGFGLVNRRRRYGPNFLLLCVATISANAAQAAGLWLYEQATPDLGTASAGRAATADNAATAASNPAGMTRLNQSELMVGIQPLYVKSEFDVGAGINLVYSKLTQKTAINNPEPGLADGKLKLEDDDIGYGLELGVLLTPVEGTRFGLTYLSEVDLKYNDVLSLKGLGPVLGAVFGENQKVDLEMNLRRRSC